MIYTKKKGLVFQLGDATIQGAKQKVIVKSQNIELGEGAMEKLILGNKFLTFFNSHTHPTGVGPSGVPVVLMSDPLHLSQVSKTK